MTDDLTARLERALQVQERHDRDLRPDAATLADLHARVARGRRGRVTSHVAVAAAAAAAIGVAGWFGLQHRDAPQPARTPEPSATASPTLTSTPSPSAAATAPPLEPVNLPGMPPMSKAPEGLLERTGPGWYLLTYESGLYQPPSGDGERKSLVLSAPTGELYHLMDVASGTLMPVRWAEPGVARVVFWESPRPGRAGWVDLRTGEVTPDERLGEDVEWVGMSGDGEIWRSAPTGGQGALVVVPPQGEVRSIPVALTGVLLSPDGRTVAGWGEAGTLETVDVATGRITPIPVPAGQRCDIVGWLDPTGFMATCVDVPPAVYGERWNADEHGGRVVRFDADGGVPQTLTTLAGDGVMPWRGSNVRDGVLVAAAAPELSGTSTDCYQFCYGGAYLWTGGDVRPVTTSVDLGDEVCEVRAGRDGLLLRTGDFCWEEITSGQWWLVDEATGATRLVAPAVESELGIGAGTLVERS